MTAVNANAQKVLHMIAGAPSLDTLAPDAARSASKGAFLLLQGPKPDVAAVSDHSADGIALRLYRPAGSQADQALPVCLYFHGGGFVIGDIETYDTLCRVLANASGCAVASVEYRLAPEARFPAAVEDCWAATQWIARQAQTLHLDAARMAVAGDSAGGNLAAVIALLARDAGAPRLAYQLLIYPVVQLSQVTDSSQRNAEGYFLTARLMSYFAGHYLGDNTAALQDFRLAPLHAQSHANLPPASILVCGFDPLHDDGVMYRDCLQAAGVPVQFTALPDQIHGMVTMDGAIPEARAAVQKLGQQMGQALRAA